MQIAAPARSTQPDSEAQAVLLNSEGHDSSSSMTSGINLENYEREMAKINQEIQDLKSKQIASDKDLAKELQKQEFQAPPDAFQLDADEERQAIVNQETADIKGRMMNADESLAREIQRQDQQSTNVDQKVGLQTRTPFKEHEVTAKDVSTLFSGKKSSLNDKNNKNN